MKMGVVLLFLGGCNLYVGNFIIGSALIIVGLAHLPERIF